MLLLQAVYYKHLLYKICQTIFQVSIQGVPPIQSSLTSLQIPLPRLAGARSKTI
jgi:hypothetical protein